MNVSHPTDQEILLVTLDTGEEDYNGLYEIGWALNRNFSDQDGEAFRQRWRSVASQALRGGLIEFYKTEDWKAFKKVTLERAEKAASDNGIWSAPHSNTKTHFVFANTVLGDKKYAQLYDTLVNNGGSTILK